MSSKKNRNPNRLHGRAMILNRIERNGITVKDIEEAEQRAFQRGYNNACAPTYKICCAAAVLALHRHYGFGKKRCCEFLHHMDQQVITKLDSIEACQEVFDEIGLELDYTSFDSCMMK